MPYQNTTVQRLKLAAPALDLPCPGLVTNSVEIPTTGNSHKKKPVGLLTKYYVEKQKSVILNTRSIAIKLWAEKLIKSA